jgi:hypothetical protein
MVSGDLLEGLAATDGFHGHLGLELRAVGSSLAHRWEAPSGGGAPPQRLTMGPVQKSQTTSHGDPQANGRTALSGGLEPSANCSPLATAAQRGLAGSHQMHHILRTLQIRSG